MARRGINIFSNDDMQVEGKRFSWLTIKEGETKQIRFLTDGDEVAEWWRHYIKTDKFKGALCCLNDPRENKFNCPLCKVASKEWNAPIGAATQKMLAIVIDRNEDDAVKVMEATRGVAAILSADYEANGTFIDVDYSFKKGRSKKNNWIEYELKAIRSTIKPLTKEEIAKKSTINLDEIIASYTKSEDELKSILDGASAKVEPKKEEKKKTKAKVDEKPEEWLGKDGIAGDDFFKDIA